MQVGAVRIVAQSFEDLGPRGAVGRRELLQADAVAIHDEHGVRQHGQERFKRFRAALPALIVFLTGLESPQFAEDEN